MSKREWCHALTVLLAVMLSAACPLTLSAAPPISAEELNRYLAEKSSPLANQGQALIESGRRWNVDPRLVVAIAGAETSFGNRVCADFNAWNWFYRDTSRCSANAFTSWQEGIETVSRGLRRVYLDENLATISQIAAKYTITERETWSGNVLLFYRDELGGDPRDLTYGENPSPAPSSSRGDSKIIFISGFRSYNRPDDPAAVSSWERIREAILQEALLRQAFQGDDMLYFSYSGLYASRYYEFGMPIYAPEDTYPHPSNAPSPLSHTVPFDSMLLGRVIDQLEGSHVILVGHSLGGVVATHWAANRATRQDLELVDLIITLASPLRGVPVMGSDLFPDVLDVAPNSELIQSLRDAPRRVRLFTIRSTDDVAVLQDFATLPDVWHDMRGELGDHSAVKEHPHVRVEITAAIRAVVTGQELLSASQLNTPAYDIVLPGETAQVTLEVQNTGTLRWLPDQGLVLEAVGEPQQGMPSSVTLPNEIAPGEIATCALRIPQTGGWGVRRYAFRMHLRDNPFGPVLMVYVFVLPNQLKELEEDLRKRIEDWRRQAEQEIDELIQDLLRTIQEEVERQTRRKLDELCGPPAGALVLTLATTWFVRRRPIEPEGSDHRPGERGRGGQVH